MLGLILGSFTTALAHRVPENLPWFMVTGRYKRSLCPKCSQALGLADLIPVFSWLFNRGQCRHCGKCISIKYPVIELVVMAVVIAVFLAKGMSVEAFILASLVPFLVALAIIDFEKMILPDQLVAISAVLTGVLLSWQVVQSGDTTLFLTHGMAALVYGLVAWGLGEITSRLVGRSALGFGDVKFFAVAGLGLGLQMLPVFMILAGTLGILIALAWRLMKSDSLFPFGPALIVAYYSLLVFT